MLQDMKELIHQIKNTKNAVVLLEGTRNLPKTKEPSLISFAEQLALGCPDVKFRTGNSSGTDEAFAQGIANINPSLLEYVIPYKTMRKSKLHKKARIVSLDEIPTFEQAQLKAETIKSYPSIANLIDYYFDKGIRNRLSYKAMYLLRDSLKVIGSDGIKLNPATLGIFYVDPEKPLTGGTGHTIRVCKQNKIPALTQGEWRSYMGKEYLI